jgi:hypothetical protein
LCFCSTQIAPMTSPNSKKRTYEIFIHKNLPLSTQIIALKLLIKWVFNLNTSTYWDPFFSSSAEFRLLRGTCTALRDCFDTHYRKIPLCLFTRPLFSPANLFDEAFESTPTRASFDLLQTAMVTPFRFRALSWQPFQRRWWWLVASFSSLREKGQPFALCLKGLDDCRLAELAVELEIFLRFPSSSLSPHHIQVLCAFAVHLNNYVSCTKRKETPFHVTTLETMLHPPTTTVQSSSTQTSNRLCLRTNYQDCVKLAFVHRPLLTFLLASFLPDTVPFWLSHAQNILLAPHFLCVVENGTREQPNLRSAFEVLDIFLGELSAFTALCGDPLLPNLKDLGLGANLLLRSSIDLACSLVELWSNSLVSEAVKRGSSMRMDQQIDILSYSLKVLVVLDAYLVRTNDFLLSTNSNVLRRRLISLVLGEKTVYQRTELLNNTLLAALERRPGAFGPQMFAALTQICISLPKLQ